MTPCYKNCGSGSRLDPDLLGYVDPDPEEKKRIGRKYQNFYVGAI
jgi:hypothetical protein